MYYQSRAIFCVHFLFYFYAFPSVCAIFLPISKPAIFFNTFLSLRIFFTHSQACNIFWHFQVRYILRRILKCAHFLCFPNCVHHFLTHSQACIFFYAFLSVCANFWTHSQSCAFFCAFLSVCIIFWRIPKSAHFFLMRYQSCAIFCHISKCTRFLFFYAFPSLHFFFNTFLGMHFFFNVLPIMCNFLTHS